MAPVRDCYPSASSPLGATGAFGGRVTSASFMFPLSAYPTGLLLEEKRASA
jgi:hypothetical protein